MAELIVESGFQYVLTGMILAGSLWGRSLTANMIPLFTRSLTRHPRGALR